jgi:hypothetical protein
MISDGWLTAGRSGALRPDRLVRAPDTKTSQGHGVPDVQTKQPKEGVYVFYGRGKAMYADAEKPRAAGLGRWATSLN